MEKIDVRPFKKHLILNWNNITQKGKNFILNY